MGMDMESGRPAPLPNRNCHNHDAFGQAHQHLEKPNEAGRKIGIHRK